MRQGYKTHISDDKKKLAAGYAKLILDYPIVGVVNLENLPSQQLNNMRRQLRESKVIIKVGKKRLFKIAIEKSKEVKKQLEQLEEYLKGIPALIFTKENPFALFKLIKKNKSKASARPGQIAPADITVSAGPTPFTPGPIISELAGFGIKTKVENGKLNIIEDVVVAKEGDILDDKMASLLQKLGIEPMEIGLDLVAIYEQGVVYTKSVLDIDEDKFKLDLDNCARWAFNLSIEAGYPTKDNITVFITKAFQQTKAVALEADIMTADTIKDILIKANNQMLSVKSALKI